MYNECPLVNLAEIFRLKFVKTVITLVAGYFNLKKEMAEMPEMPQLMLKALQPYHANCFDVGSRTTAMVE